MALFLPGLTRYSRKALARARVVVCSSLVAMNEGHIVPPISTDFRQSPEPLHCSTCLRNPRLAEWSKTGLMGISVLMLSAVRRKVSIFGVSVIFPLLKIPFGSQTFFSVRNNW